MRRLGAIIIAILFTGMTMILVGQYVMSALQPALDATSSLPPEIGGAVHLIIIGSLIVLGPVVLFLAIVRVLLKAIGEEP
jgi:hypothetical protein